MCCSGTISNLPASSRMSSIRLAESDPARPGEPPPKTTDPDRFLSSTARASVTSVPAPQQSDSHTSALSPPQDPPASQGRTAFYTPFVIPTIHPCNWTRSDRAAYERAKECYTCAKLRWCLSRLRLERAVSFFSFDVLFFRIGQREARLKVPRAVRSH